MYYIYTSNPLQKLSSRCFRCGSSNHVKECPLKDDLSCKKRNKKGHATNVCLNDKSKNRNSSESFSRPRSIDSKFNHASSITCQIEASSKPTPRINIHLSPNSNHSRGFRFADLPDTGASRSLVALDILKRYDIPFNPSNNEKLFVANGNQMKCEGSITLFCKYQKIVAKIDAVVSSDLRNEILISWFDLQALKIIPADFPSGNFCSNQISGGFDRKNPNGF